MRNRWRHLGVLLGVLGLGGVLFWAGSGTAKPLLKEKQVKKDQGYLAVHEWGTFLSVQGSDGVTLGGMVDSEEHLPLFVRERVLQGISRGAVSYKMETPVTYFYTDRPRVVTLRVDMPQGVLTHWFPAVASYDNQKGAKTGKKESFLDWGQIELTPPGNAKGLNASRLKSVGKENTWNYVRDTDAAYVKVANIKRGGQPYPEYEKFLFYRGLASLNLPLQVRDGGEFRVGKPLILKNRGKQTLKGVFAIRVEKDSLQFAELADLEGGASLQFWINSVTTKQPAFPAPQPLKEGVPEVKKALEKALTKAGLYDKEARAMVNNWEHSYFQTEGLRVLYVIPRAVVDATIPLKISPKPDHLVRVMVGRVEVLTKTKEREVENILVKFNAAKGDKERSVAGAALDRLGRLKEPVLRRILATTKKGEVRDLAKKLIPNDGVK
jgi:hypothetical protein